MIEDGPPQLVPQSSFSIHAQTVSGNARVHNGNNYITKRSSTLNSRQRKEILNWLSPLSFHQTHENIREKSRLSEQSSILCREHFSGQWLLDSDIFDQWRSRTLRKLWYLGMPGAGKTVLASTIILHLTELLASLKPDKKNGRVAYLYLSYKESHTLEQLIGSVIKQIVRDEIPLPQPLIDLWSRRIQGDEDPTKSDLQNLFYTLVEEQPVYIVIDALDECPSEYRVSLLRILQSADKASILVTSRLLDEFNNISQDFERVNIQADPKDLNLFIDYEFNANARLKKYAVQDANLLTDVKHRIRDRCDGMFLLASLHMQSLVSARNLAGVREQLLKLPKRLDEMYQLTIDRIAALEDTPKRLALDTLAWIVLCCRSLRIHELQHALAVVPGSREFDPTRVFEADDIRDVCGGLVTIVDSNVALVHYTTLGYLKNISEKLFPGFHAVIAQTCISYLSFDVLEQPDDPVRGISYADSIYEDPEESDDPANASNVWNGLQKSSKSPQYPVSRNKSTRLLSYNEKYTQYCFLNYSATYLSYNLRQPSDASPQRTLELLEVLLQERSKRNFLWHLLYNLQILDTYSTFSSKPRSYTPVAEDTCIEDTRYEDSDTKPNLEIDVDDLLQMILERSDSEDKIYKKDLSTARTSPLLLPSSSLGSHDSSQSDNASILSNPLPTENSVPDDVIEQEGSIDHHEVTALHLASFLGWVPIVVKFAENSPNVNVRDTYDQTALTIAVKKGYWDVINVLLNHGASVNLSSWEGHATLLYAAQEDSGAVVVKALITQALEPPLSRSNHTTVSDTTNMFSYIFGTITFLLRIVSRMCYLIFKQQINSISTKSITKSASKITKTNYAMAQTESLLQLLDAAASGNCEAIRNLIKDNRVHLSTESSMFHGTALYLAIEFNYAAVVRELLENGVDGNISGLGNCTPLHRAVARNSIEIVKLILEYKPDLELKDDHGQTAWSANMNVNHLKILGILRAAGANPDADDEFGVANLYVAAAGGHTEATHFLLENGANPSRQTNFGWAPLHWAANNGHLECVRALIDAGADLSPMSDRSTTPLDMAISAHRDIIAGELKKLGALTAVEVIARATASRNSPDELTISNVEADHYSDSDSIDSENSVMSESEVTKVLNTLFAVMSRVEERENISEKEIKRVLIFVLDYLEENEDKLERSCTTEGLNFNLSSLLRTCRQRKLELDRDS